ncbi:MAG: hypothetical protein ACLPY5_03270 [Candidatus Bathyarchaeia archaeon]
MADHVYNSVSSDTPDSLLPHAISSCKVAAALLDYRKVCIGLQVEERLIIMVDIVSVLLAKIGLIPPDLVSLGVFLEHSSN